MPAHPTPTPAGTRAPPMPTQSRISRISTASTGNERLPPGQRETDRFPVLSKSGTPSWDPETFEFEVWGAIEEPLSYSLSAFRDLPSVTQRQDFHCVTGWSKFDCAFTGVEFEEIVDRAGVHDDAEHVLFHALDGYTTNLSLEECARKGRAVRVRIRRRRPPSGPRWANSGRHAAQVRAYKGAKWVSGVEFLTEKELGYWEKRGYSDTANPWNEERYS